MAERGAGARHWLAQRASAVALAPLGAWFLVAVATRAGAERAEIVAWIGQPSTALGLLALLAIGLLHARQGLEVVLVDYLHLPARRRAILEVARLVAFGLGGVGALAILVIVLRAT